MWRQDIVYTNKEIEKTLSKLFSLIKSSPAPEVEVEYLAEEFGFKADELFLLYLDYSKNSIPNSQAENYSGNLISQSFELYSSIVSKLNPKLVGLEQDPFTLEHESNILDYERRKSSPVDRLRFGLSKSIDRLHESIFIDRAREKVIVCTKAHVVRELMKYEIRSVPSSTYSSIFDYLANINLRRFEICSKVNRDQLVTAIVNDIQENFEVFHISRMI